jgi:hypothetical protein
MFGNLVSEEVSYPIDHCAVPTNNDTPDQYGFIDDARLQSASQYDCLVDARDQSTVSLI